MGQNTSKRRSYTPGQDANSELPESNVASPTAKVNGDAKVNGSIEVHEEELDVTTPTSPTSVTSATSATSTGKKEKRKKLRFIGFSLKRTPSGRWSRKRRNTAPNGTARPVSCPDPIREQANLDASGRPQSFILEEIDITEEDSKIETVDLSDHDEEAKSKTKSDDKQAPKAPERNKGKRGSKKGSKKKKEKKSSKKDKQKKSKKLAPEPNVGAAAAAVTETAASAEAKVAASVQETMQASTAAAVNASPPKEPSSPGAKSDDNTGLEAMASNIVQESVAIAQKRLMAEDNAVEVSSPQKVAIQSSVQNDSSPASPAGEPSQKVDVEEIPPPESFADTGDADVSFVDEVINAINAEPTSNKEPEEQQSERNVSSELPETAISVEVPAEKDANIPSNDGIEIPDRPVVADIISGIEQDIAASTMSPAFVAKVNTSENTEVPSFTTVTKEVSKEIQAEIATPVSQEADIIDKSISQEVTEADTSISKEAAEAVAVAEQAEAEIQALVASSESTVSVETPTLEAKKEVNLEVSAQAEAASCTLDVDKSAVVVKNNSVDEKITEAAVDVPNETLAAVSAAASHAEKAAVKKSVSDSDSEKARKAELEKEKKEKERLERERLKKEKEEQKSKEKERIKQEKKKKAEQKAAEKAEKEKTKEKKSIVPKRLSQLFHKKEKPRTIAEIEVNAQEAGASSAEGKQEVEANPSTVEVAELTKQENGPEVSTASSHSEQNKEESTETPPSEGAVNSSLTIDVSVEPLVKSDLSVENPSSPSSPSSDSLNQSATDSAPGSPTSDTQEVVSDGGSGESPSGVLKKISIGPRLRTAILRKKSSGASDSGQTVSLTTPKVVENADITPPPRKLGPRHPKEQYSPITPGAHNPAAIKDSKSEDLKTEELPSVETGNAKDNEAQDEDRQSDTFGFNVVIPDDLAKKAQDVGSQLLDSVSASVTVDSQDNVKCTPANDSSLENEIISETPVGSHDKEQTSVDTSTDAVQVLTKNKNVIIDNVSCLLQTDSSEKDTESSDVINDVKDLSVEKPAVVEEVVSVVQQVSQHCSPYECDKSQSTPHEVQTSVIADTPEVPQVDDKTTDVPENSLPDAKEVSSVVGSFVGAAIQNVQETFEPVSQITGEESKIEAELGVTSAETAVEEAVEKSVIVTEQSSSFTEVINTEKDDYDEDEDDDDDSPINSPTLVSTASIILRPSLTDDIAAPKVASTESTIEDTSAFLEEQPTSQADDSQDGSSGTPYTVKCAAQTVTETVVCPALDVSNGVQENESQEEESSVSETVSKLAAQVSEVVFGTSETTANESEQTEQRSPVDASNQEKEASTSENDAPNSTVEKLVKETKAAAASMMLDFEEPTSTTIAEYHIGVSQDEDKQHTDVEGSTGSASDEANLTLTQPSNDNTFDDKLEKLSDELEKTITQEGDENANEISSALKSEIEIKTNGCIQIDVSHPQQNGVGGSHDSPNKAEVSVSLNDSAIEKDLDDSDDVKDGVVVNGDPSLENKTEPTNETIEAYLKLQTSELNAEKDKSGDKHCMANGSEEATKADNIIPDHSSSILDQAEMTG